jgi:hypothetical protein
MWVYAKLFTIIKADGFIGVHIKRSLKKKYAHSYGLPFKYGCS